MLLSSMCLFSSFSTEYTRFCLITVGGADSQAKLGCFPSSQEEALRSVYTGTDVDRTHFSAAVKAAQSSNSHTGLRLVKVWVQFSEYSCFY